MFRDRLRLREETLQLQVAAMPRVVPRYRQTFSVRGRSFAVPTAVTHEPWSDALAMPEQIVGYDVLGRMASTGDVSDAARVFDACDGFWDGVAAWATARGLGIESSTHVV